ncbi:helix-turn-helix domain-containing protein [Hyalangium sp.]|uniref:helix-turn-helix transcriptional regulator n=1 Tax=Hyalangium sp. TaxID=2028555 RepID=UPI002D24AC1F|nr:helix-turn-helix domain-containing protein [Hyalangium sp.]HYI02846.1 helix-turn-helix domain-containing protein [Hyalangium sp.]
MDRGSHTPAHAGCPLKNRRSSRRNVAAWADRHFVVGRACASARDVVSEEKKSSVVAQVSPVGHPQPCSEQPLVEALWDVRGLAAYLNVSTSWVYQRVATRTIPCVHLGAAVRFIPEDIRAWLRGERGGQVVRIRDYRPRPLRKKNGKKSLPHAD